MKKEDNKRIGMVHPYIVPDVDRLIDSNICF